MKCEYTYPKSRTLRITGIEGGYAEDLTTPGELTIQVSYTEDPNEGGRATKAVVLDHVIVPLIVAALNDEKKKPFNLNKYLESLTDAQREEIVQKAADRWLRDRDRS